MKTVYLFLFTLLLSAPSLAQLDENGWTILDPANAEKIVYVSSSAGDDATGTVYSLPASAIGTDPQHPATTINAFKTIAAAEAKVTTGEAAWILLKTGDTFYEQIKPKAGESGTRPMVYSYYGSGIQLPLLKVGTGTAVKSCCKDFSNFWLIGLSFYAHTRNPDDPDYVSSAGSSGISFYTGDTYTIENILIEGCVLRFFENNVVQGAGTVTGIKIRRNVIVDNYSEEAHSQGLYASNVNGLVLEENIFDHNGWYKQSVNSDNNKLEGQATIFNHNTYFAGVHNVSFIGNSFYRPSSIGTKWTANGGEASTTNISIIDNLYYDFEVGISIGGNESVPPYRFQNITLTDNIFTAAGLSRPTNRTLGWGIDINDWDNGICNRNLLIHQNSNEVTNGYGMNITGQTRDLQVRENILYNLEYTHGMKVTGAEFTNVNISDNELTLDLSDNRFFIEKDQASPSLFSGNTYAGTGNAGELFKIGTTRMSYSSWVSTSGETGSDRDTPQYNEPERSVELYVTEILGLSGMAEYYTELRKQSRLSWREEYTAPVINHWIREGFQEVVTGVSDPLFKSDSDLVYPNPAENFLNVNSGNRAVVKLFAITGEEVLNTEISANEKINISMLEPGYYFIQVKEENSGNTKTDRFVKR